jgi:hypothetical protein
VARGNDARRKGLSPLTVGGSKPDRPGHCPTVGSGGAQVAANGHAGGTCPTTRGEPLSLNLMRHRDRVFQLIPTGVGLHGAIGTQDERMRGVLRDLPDFSFNLRWRSGADDAVPVQATHKGPFKQLRDIPSGNLAVGEPHVAVDVAGIVVNRVVVRVKRHVITDVKNIVEYSHRSILSFRPPVECSGVPITRYVLTIATLPGGLSAPWLALWTTPICGPQANHISD